MDCKISQENLIDFQFGSLDIDSRSLVESHLASCPDCLQEFFLLKRDAESAHAIMARPAAAVKNRISREFSAYSHSLVVAHPKKLIFGGLVAAAALILVILNPTRKWNEPSKIDSAPKIESVRSLGETVDSAGSNPGHINIL